MNELKEAMMEKRQNTKTVRPADLLSTGSTPLNLACSGRKEGGFAKGQYVLFVGDTDSGKTWLTMTCMAEATINPNFRKHRLIFDNAENGAWMDLERYFGKALFDRLEAPRYSKSNEPIFSRTSEDFYFNVDDAIKRGEPFIYALDSIDILDADADEKKFEKAKKAARTGKETAGSYGTAKAKINSEYLRKVVGDIEQTESILIIINQTRDNIDAMPFTPKKTRSGGWALEFYAHLQLWASVGGQITRTVRGKKRQIGMSSKVKVKRSRMTGKKRDALVPIYFSIGIDDVGGCVDYLVDEGAWSKNSSGVIKASGLEEKPIEAKGEKLIQIIEEKDLVDELKDMVVETWNEIEDKCRVERKPKYGAVES